MSPGKLASQVSYGSMAFLTSLIRRWSSKENNHDLVKQGCVCPYDNDEIAGYNFEYFFDRNLYEQWIDGEFTKCVLQAKNKNQLLKAKTMAEELGMKEGEDFWLVCDNCHTELEPEEDGRTLTVIGFKPMDSEIIDQIDRKYHLYV